MPFSYYDTIHPAASNGFSTSCPTGASVRGCFQTILGTMRSQAVSGIRVFVTFCDSASLVFSNCGSPWTQVSWNPIASPPNTQYKWIQNVKSFFEDVNAAGIQNVTLTFGSSGGVGNTFTVASSATSSPKSPTGTNCSEPGGLCCLDTPATVMFNPYVPFGMDPATGYPIGYYYASPKTSLNQGWNCAPVNSNYFLGWTNQFNVINAVLGAAKGLVTVYELETQQELNTMSFPVLLRYLYDNSMPQSAGLPQGATVDVVSNLRSLMSANGFDPNRVIWSALWVDSTSATYNCSNVYTDFARNTGMDSVTQAINGGYIGTSTLSTVTDALVCGGSSPQTTMFTVPVYSTLPDLVDVHVYPSVTQVSNTDAQIQQVAALDYGDMPHFLALASLQSAAMVLGETYAGTLYPGEVGGFYCWGTSINNPKYFPGYPLPSGTPADNVAGFNQSSLAAQTVIFRAWMEIEDPSGPCFPYGGGPASGSNYQNVNYNGNGPYTPTNH